MTRRSGRVVPWIARAFGVALCLFVGMFALDSFSDGRPLGDSLMAFLIHLVPAGLLLVIVLAAWRRPWIGGVAFVALAVLYAATMAKGRPDWMVAISGPLLVGAVLYLWSWRQT